MVIWDESLLVSDHRAMSKFDLQSELGWLGPQLEKVSNNRNVDVRREALAYLTDCMSILEMELRQQDETGREPRALRLPERPLETLDSYVTALKGYPVQSVHDLLEVSQEPLRVVRSVQSGGCYVSYDVARPARAEAHRSSGRFLPDPRA